MKCISFSTVILKCRKDDHRSRINCTDEDARNSREMRMAKRDQMAAHARLLKEENAKIATERLRAAIRLMQSNGIDVASYAPNWMTNLETQKTQRPRDMIIFVILLDIAAASKN